jgi:glycosyltransferase involved in cell wall biosynthesis
MNDAPIDAPIDALISAAAALTPRAPRRHTLSVCMICKNEADRIEPCLQSVAGWADEVIVYDSGSTDGTLEILSRYPVQVTVTDWPGYGPQRQRSLLAARGEYVLTLDADERVSPALRAEIDAELSKATVPCAVYRMPWQPVILGKTLKHGGRYGSPQARLFRREGAAFPDKQVHETLIPPPGPWGRFKGKLVHDSYRNYRHMVDKHTQYAWLLAVDKFKRGKRTHIWTPPLRFAWEFVLQYFIRGLVLDGAHGFLLAVVLSQYAFHKYGALWTMQQTGKAQ